MELFIREMRCGAFVFVRLHSSAFERESNRKMRNFKVRKKKKEKEICSNATLGPTWRSVYNADLEALDP